MLGEELYCLPSFQANLINSSETCVVHLLCKKRWVSAALVKVWIG